MEHLSAEPAASVGEVRCSDVWVISLLLVCLVVWQLPILSWLQGVAAWFRGLDPGTFREYLSLWVSAAVKLLLAGAALGILWRAGDLGPAIGCYVSTQDPFTWLLNLPPKIARLAKAWKGRDLLRPRAGWCISPVM